MQSQYHVAQQFTLFGRGLPSIGSFQRVEHIRLSPGAWIERHAEWLDGHERLFAALVHHRGWQQTSRVMYENVVAVPRLLATPPTSGMASEVIVSIAEALETRYGRPLRHVTMAYYRDGKDSVAWHADALDRNRQHGLVCTVSLGAPRRFLLRPKGGTATHAFQLGWGDLCVMGGDIQKTWEHAIPKCSSAGPRIVLMFRGAADPQDPSRLV